MKAMIAKILSITVVLTMALLLASCGGKSTQGEQGIPGIQGLKGSDGLTPFIGENGNWWIGETDTGVCATGKDGRDGVDGKDGRDGIDGRDGVDGKDGAAGIPGENGAPGNNGNDGVPGRHVTSFEINDSGELVVLYSDNATQNLGKIVPEDGKDGSTIASAEIEGGGLIITMTDGKVFYVGNVKGEDAIQPMLRINGDTKQWEVSYDNGKSWEDLGYSASGDNGKDAVTPLLRINSDTAGWEVSYDNGETWHDLGFSAGADDGKDGITPQIRINADTKEWEVSYNNGLDWHSLGYNASAQQGLMGITPMIRLNYDTRQWQVSYDNGQTWEDAGYSGRNEQEINERVIVNIEIVDGYLWVTYEDSDTPVNMGKVPS